MEEDGNHLYGRGDLNDEEKRIFDEMVAEEMEKLENQFKNSVIEEEKGEYRSPPRIKPDSYNKKREETLQNRDFPLYKSDTSGEPSKDYSSINSNSPHSATANQYSRDDGEVSRQPAQRAPRGGSLVAENYPAPRQDDGGMSFTQDKSITEKRQAQRSMQDS
jgi:hypothetical protein